MWIAHRESRGTHSAWKSATPSMARKSATPSMATDCRKLNYRLRAFLSAKLIDLCLQLYLLSTLMMCTLRAENAKLAQAITVASSSVMFEQTRHITSGLELTSTRLHPYSQHFVPTCQSPIPSSPSPPTPSQSPLYRPHPSLVELACHVSEFDEKM